MIICAVIHSELPCQMSMVLELASAINKAVPVWSARTLAGRSYRISPTSFLANPQEHTPRSPSTRATVIPQTLHPQPIRFSTQPLQLHLQNPTSSAPETVLVCQSRISKLSTRSRKRMKTPARSSRISRTIFTFVSNVRPS
jgi:hypothetical protein